MAGLLESFGQGLQGAGAVLSSEVYQTQAHERQNALVNIGRMLEITKAKRALDADMKFSEFTAGMQPSAMTSESLLDTAKKIPLDILTESPRAHQFMQMVSQVQARETAAETRKEAVQARYMQIEQQAEAARQRSEDRQLGIQERAAADRRHNDLQRALMGMRADALKQGIELRRDALDEQKRHNRALEEARAEAATAKAEAKTEKETAPVQDIIQDIDQAIKTIRDNPGVTGARGMVSRVGELVSTSISGDTNTPANDFQSQILQIQSKWRKLPTVAANRFKSDVNKIDNIVKGLGVGSNDAIAINGLTELRNNLARGIEAKGGEVPANPNIDAGKPNVKAAVEAAGQVYEPDKYDYRVVDGKVQRKPKGG